MVNGVVGALGKVGQGIFYRTSPPRLLLLRSASKSLSAGLARHLQNDMHVTPDSLGQLRCVALRGRFEGQGVRFVRIFDPQIAQQKGVAVSHYQDLNSHLGLVLFQGHIFDKDNSIYIADRRQPMSHTSRKEVISKP